MVFAWSRGIDPAQLEHYSRCISEKFITIILA